MVWSKGEMVARAAKEIQEGEAVNLGIGMPTLVANEIPPEKEVWLHSENGLLGMGPFPYEGEEDPKIINAGKQTVTVETGGSFFDSALSFGMIRGGHLDLCILGGMEVSAGGDLANWMVPGRRVNGMGGAMDLVSGAKRVVVLRRHQTREGEAKLLSDCTLPLTGAHCVTRVITELGVFDPDPTRGGFVVQELASGVSIEAARAATGAPLWVGEVEA
ncbi:MAG: 3-oxoacid CoA-transferase subunit B [Myxococcota bacterium]|nr:3-oxoacid CoA-transferase subunit B [Myxococcota bacterium]